MPKSISKTAILLLLAASALCAAAVPRPAPPLRLKTLTGETVSLWAMRGDVVVLMFLSTDCAHCHEAVKILTPLYNELKPRGFEILGLATNSSAAENLGRFAEQFQIRFPLALASRVDWARFGQFEVRGRPPYVPHLLFVDRGGAIRAEFRGEDRAFYDNLEERFRAIAESLLNEAHAGKPFSE